MTLYDNHCAVCGVSVGKSNRHDSELYVTCLACKARAGSEVAAKLLAMIPVCSCCGKKHG